jgi:hypothetical protein
MTRCRRPARGEDGYAMIVTVTVVMILTMLLVVVLGQAVHNNVATVYGARRATALAVAEGGTNWAIAALQADPTTAAAASNRAVPVADGSGATGTATVTVRQGTPSSPGKLGWYTVYSTGSLGIAGAPTRTVRVVLGPSPSFPFALYADTSLTLEQNACIVGTVFSQGDVSFKNNAAVAGTGTIRGSLISETGVITQFNGANKAACPSTVNGEAVDTTYDVHGDVLAGGGSLAPCRTAPAGAIDASTSGFNLNGATVGGRACNNPPPYTMPEYTFLPRNYGTIQYYGKPPGYGSASATAGADFNGALSAGTLPSSAGALDRAYVVWQDLSAYQASGTTRRRSSWTPPPCGSPPTRWSTPTSRSTSATPRRSARRPPAPPPAPRPARASWWSAATPAARAAAGWGTAPRSTAATRSSSGRRSPSCCSPTTAPSS